MQIQALIKKPSFLLFCLLLFVTISRIPLLFPDRMILDGDEALMGLMSIREIELGEMPWFFWGQQYGFTFIEVNAISFFHLLLGYNDLAVKLAMLSLWLLGIAGLFLFLKEKTSAPVAFAALLLVSIHPVWFFWSLKARGGYLTALCASSWVFYFAQHKRIAPWLKGLLAGILLAIVYHAMKLWFPSTFLVLLAILLQEKKRIPIGLITLGIFTVTFVGLHQLALLNPDYWNPEVAKLSLWKKNLSLSFYRLKIFFEGNNFLGDIYPIKNWTNNAWVVAKWWMILSFPLALLQWKERKDKAGQLLMLLAALIPLGVLLITSEFYSPRYLLPAPFFITIWAAMQWHGLRLEGIARFAFIISALVFLAGSWQLTRLSYFQKESLERLEKMKAAQLLMDDGYTHILCNSPETHWQLMYYSQGKLICSGIYPHDRFQKFPDEVRKAYKAGEPVPAHGLDQQEYRGLGTSFQPYGPHFLIEHPQLWQLDSMFYDMRTYKDWKLGK